MRTADVPPDLIWRCWTEPDLLMKWFTPAPWQTVKCEIDLRPGGVFHTVMRSPEGDEFPGDGCYLEVEAPHRLSWTNGLAPGFRPLTPAAAGEEFAGEESHVGFQFTARMTFEADGKGGTLYTATVFHATEADCKTHNDMGFQDGWGAAFGQLMDLVKTL